MPTNAPPPGGDGSSTSRPPLPMVTRALIKIIRPKLYLIGIKAIHTNNDSKVPKHCIKSQILLALAKLSIPTACLTGKFLDLMPLGKNGLELIANTKKMLMRDLTTNLDDSSLFEVLVMDLLKWVTPYILGPMLAAQHGCKIVHVSTTEFCGVLATHIMFSDKYILCVFRDFLAAFECHHIKADHTLCQPQQHTGMPRDAAGWCLADCEPIHAAHLHYKAHACFACYLFGHIVACCPNLRHYTPVPSPHHIPQTVLPTYNTTDNPPGPGHIVPGATARPSDADAPVSLVLRIAPVAPATTLKGGSNARFRAAMADMVKTLLGHMRNAVVAGDLAAVQQMMLSFVSMAKSTGLDKPLYAGLMLPSAPVAAVAPKPKHVAKSNSKGKDKHPAHRTTPTQTNCEAIAKQHAITATASMATLLPGETAAQALAHIMAWFTARQSAWTTPALPAMLVSLPAPLSVFSAAAGLLAPTTPTTPTNLTTSTAAGSVSLIRNTNMEVDTVSIVPFD
ncbi:hypothetical protein BC828DRAFT_400003 [Blastocladiella britannica]|nr:hypothetical protein BC828DRAFT_400003 [Blastocladiella britannica]